MTTPDPITPERWQAVEWEWEFTCSGCQLQGAAASHLLRVMCPDCGTMTERPDPPCTPERVTLTETELWVSLLTEHQGWCSERYAPALHYVACCDCGWESGERSPHGDLAPHRAHVAEVLARAAGEREAALRALADEWDDLRPHDPAGDLRALLDGDEETTT